MATPEFDSARYNLPWFLSIAAPIVIMFAATFNLRRWVMIIGVIASIITTYVLCNIAVQQKWKTRFDYARTESEREYACRDGANLAFTSLIIAPVESVASTTLFGIIGWRTWSRVRKRRETQQRHNQSLE